MFIFRINHNFIVLLVTILIINSCTQSNSINPNVIINNSTSKSTLTNKIIIVNKKNKVNDNKNFIVNNTSQITKKKLNLLDGIASNIINENDVVFEFRNERLLQGREVKKFTPNKKRKKALIAVFKMLKRSSSLENQSLSFENEENIEYSIDYSLNSKKTSNNIVIKNILVFLPFTGPYSNHFGNKIRKAIDLSILRFGSEKIKVIYFDTGSNYLLDEVESLIQEIKPDLILGPFTRSSVLKIKPYVKKNTIPMFAFTNDIALVEKNIWSLGYSPEEQIDSIISCALNKGYRKYGLIVPNNLYGKIILDRSIDNLKLQANTSFEQLLLSNSEMKDKPKLGSILKRFLAYQEQQNQNYLSKFDAIFIGGNKNFILEIAPLLAFYDIDSKKVQILGTEKFNAKAIKDEPSLEGAWFPTLLDKKERNETVMFYKEDDELKKIEHLVIINKNSKSILNNLSDQRQKIFADRKNRTKSNDFKIVWKDTWKEEEDYFSQVGFDAGILAINFLNQQKPIEEYIQNIEGLVTGFKFTENGHVTKANIVVEIQKSGKVIKIKKCFHNN